jgi:hypothetical protein
MTGVNSPFQRGIPEFPSGARGISVATAVIGCGVGDGNRKSGCVVAPFVADIDCEEGGGARWSPRLSRDGALVSVMSCSCAMAAMRKAGRVAEGGR